MEIFELGTDVSSKWVFEDGDLKIINDEKNLSQSVKNRLNCKLESMNYFYENYGSCLKSFYGLKGNSRVLDFIKIEIESTLKQDPRLEDAVVNVAYMQNGLVKININSYYDDDSDLSMSFVLSESGEVLEDGD